MSGHNKWSTIKHKKARMDAKRGKLFTKLIREITVAARLGGGSEEHNPRLRQAIANAKAANMPMENIIRAIKRGTGELEGVNYEEVIYEGYGPEGVAVMVQCLTDNKNRAVAEIRHIFSKYNGKLAEPGSVSWIFSEKGRILVDASGVSEDEVMEVALEAGAEDLNNYGDTYEILTAVEDLEKVRQAIEKAGFKILEAKLTRIPNTTVRLEGHAAEVMLRLMEALEDSDEVQQVWANFDIDDSIIESMASSS